LEDRIAPLQQEYDAMWLQLTDEKGNDVYVNMDHILSFYRMSGGVTRLHPAGSMAGGVTVLDVRETPEQILEMLEKGEAANGSAY
jgi:hypothetical protein